MCMTYLFFAMLIHSIAREGAVFGCARQQEQCR